MRLQTRLLLPVWALGTGAVCLAAAVFSIVAEREDDVNDRLLAPSEVWMLALLGIVFGGVAWLQRAHIDQLMYRLRRLPIDVRSISRGGSVPERQHPEDELGYVEQRLYKFALSVRGMSTAKAEMERMAQTDPLTGLPNRRGLLNFINKVIGHNRGWIDPVQVGFMHLDLDHFKTINDTLGHDAGDFVLREAARRMEATIRETDLIARLGGDEFVIVMPGIESEDILARLAQRLIDRFNSPIVYDDKICRIGLSIGMALGPNREKLTDPQKLLSNADLALTHAKLNGRGRFAIYNSQIAAAYEIEKDLAAQIREGLLEGQFVPWFQPVVDLESKAPVALALRHKWDHPTQGVLSSKEFLQVSEMHNMASEVGLQILEAACFHIRDWRLKGIAVPNIQFQLTRSQLVAPGVVDKISWILEDANVDVATVAIEISENACEDRSSEVIFSNLKRFRDLGARVVLADFGSAGASLRKINETHASGIKVNSHILQEVANRAGSTESFDVFTRLPAIATALGLELIAAEVESELSGYQIQKLGFSVAQGNGLALPLPPSETELLLSQADVSVA